MANDKTESQKWIVTSQELGELFSVKERQIYNLVKQGLPKTGRNKFHVPTCIKWYVGEHMAGDARDINEQRKLLYKAQTDKFELENAKLRGELLETGQMQTVFFELATLIGTQIDALEPRLARQMPSELVTEFRLELKTLRESIANAVADYANTRDSSRDHPAAA